MDINRDLANRLDELTDERFHVVLRSPSGRTLERVDSLVRLLGYALSGDVIVSVEKV